MNGRGIIMPNRIDKIILDKPDVNLSNADNTSDVNKPISTAQAAALAAKVDKTTTVNGKPLSGNISITSTDVGLGNVNNTSDANKPVSTAQATAIATKVDKTTTVNGKPLSGNISINAADVGLGNVNNTSDANKPVSTAQAAAISSAVSAHETSPNPHPQYSDFLCGETRMFETRKQLSKRLMEYHPMDGQLIPRVSDPGLLAAIQSGEVPSCSDSDWLADPLKRNNYTLGDGSTTIRLPDRNGKYSGTVGVGFACGDGSKSPAPGIFRLDTMRAVKGSGGAVFRPAIVASAGCVKFTLYGPTPPKAGTIGADPGEASLLEIDTTGLPGVGDVTMPISFSLVWAVKR